MSAMKFVKRTCFVLAVVMVVSATAGFAAVCVPDAVGNVAYGFYSDDAAYSEGNRSTSLQESFSYSDKQTQSYVINASYPQYYNTDNALTNTCANVAGANVIGFYDRYYDELLPDCTAGVQRTNGYTYFPMSVNMAQKQAVIDALYVSMATNTVEAGTSQSDFEEGLASYVTSRSRNISYVGVMTGGVVDRTKYDAEFREGYPVVLFLSGYNVTTVIDANGTVTLYKNVFTGNHIMVAFGYESVTYYDADGNVVRECTFMIVATGNNGVTGYYLVGEYGTVNDAESVVIN